MNSLFSKAALSLCVYCCVLFHGEVVADVAFSESEISAIRAQGPWPTVFRQDPGNELSGQAWTGLPATYSVMTGLTLSQAKALHKKYTWDRYNMSEIDSPEIGVAVFHIQSHFGNTGIVQSALNSLGGTLNVDGDLGPLTMAELNKRIAQKGENFVYNTIRIHWKAAYNAGSDTFKQAFLNALDTYYPKKNIDLKPVFAVPMFSAVIIALLFFIKFDDETIFQKFSKTR